MYKNLIYSTTFHPPPSYTSPRTQKHPVILKHFSYFSFLKCSCSNGITLIWTWVPTSYYPLNIHRFINILCKSRYFPIERDIAVQFYVYTVFFLRFFFVNFDKYHRKNIYILIGGTIWNLWFDGIVNSCFLFFFFNGKEK